MVTLHDIAFAAFGPYQIIGKEIRTRHEPFNPIFPSKYPTIPSLWDQCFSDGTFDTLLSLTSYVPTDIPTEYVGYMRDFSREDGTFTYLVGLFMNKDTPVPDGFAAYDIPVCTLAKAGIAGEEFEIYPSAQPLTVESIQKNGYAVDWANYFTCEVYTEARFGIPKIRGEKNLILDFCMPYIANKR